MLRVIKFDGETFGFEVLAESVDLSEGPDGIRAKFQLEINHLEIVVKKSSPDYQRFGDAIRLFTLAPNE